MMRVFEPPKTLLEVFNDKKKTRSTNKAARGKGARAEGLLLRQLTEQGYEVRRTHLSAYPDIIAWNETELLMIEVKQRANTKAGISNALSVFRNSAKSVTKWHKDASILCYLRVNDAWSAFQYINNTTIPVQSVVNEER
tara:strand:- start:8704 stop:9120 length:417 start_codon:yes stop_codon:yes gene_type:complete